jgi:predicted nicotinamide N-methyase
MNPLLASLHAERVARQPQAVTKHDVEGTEVSVVEQHGTQLGSSLWHSALPLARYLHTSALWAEPRRVLELGAGCGTVGIAAALANPGCTVVLTDKPEVVDHLRANIEANAPALAAARARVCALPLVWRRAAVPPELGGAGEWESVAAAGGAAAFDIVLACECVYELSLLRALLDTMERAMAQASVAVLGFCRRGGSLCPIAQAESMLLERFEHAVPPVRTAVYSSAHWPPRTVIGHVLCSLCILRSEIV